MYQIPVPKKYRMFLYLIYSALLYGAAMNVTHPQFQLIFWKAGHLTIGAFIGYWIDRAAFPENRITRDSSPIDRFRRAVVIFGAMIAVAAGM